MEPLLNCVKKEPVKVLQALDSDAYWTTPFDVFWACPTGRRGLYFSSGLEIPSGLQGGGGKCCWAEGYLDLDHGWTDGKLAG